MKTYFSGLALLAALMFSATGCEQNVVDDDPNVPNAEVETDADLDEDVDINTTTPPLTTPPVDTTPDDPADNVDVDINAGSGTDTTADPDATNP